KLVDIELGTVYGGVAGTCGICPRGILAFNGEMLVHGIAKGGVPADFPIDGIAFGIEDDGFLHGRATAIVLVIVIDFDGIADSGGFEMTYLVLTYDDSIGFVPLMVRQGG